MTHPVRMLTPEELAGLLPPAVAWASEQERVILQSGVALAESQFADAKRVGVAHPERVRLLQVPEIPAPRHPALVAAAKQTGLISRSTAGLTLRYGIFVRGDCWGQRSLLIHELTHTRQYERFGGFEAFLRAYFLECVTPPGYPFGALEQEAKRVEHELCGRSMLDEV